VCTLIPNTLATFDKTIKVLHFLHTIIAIDFPPFVNDFHCEMEVILNQEAFVSALVLSPRFFSGGLSGMVYKFL
jgi:hypothetical protein